MEAVSATFKFAGGVKLTGHLWAKFEKVWACFSFLNVPQRLGA
jgi:hypothetical protein